MTSWNFVGVHLAQRTTEDGEILRKQINQASPDFAVAGHHAVAGNFLSSMPKSWQL